jgi:hypothetical protein
MTGTNFSDGKSALKRPRSLPVSEWPDADRRAWRHADLVRGSGQEASQAVSPR